MPCDPLADLRAWQARLERLSRHQADSWAPPVDIYETTTAYILAVELPGIRRDSVELSVEDNRLTIHGRREARPDPAGAVLYHQVERGHGAFRRTFEFAEKLDADHISANLTDGVLTITIPKVPPPPARRIEVR